MRHLTLPNKYGGYIPKLSEVVAAVSTVTRRLKKFRSGSKNLDNQTSSGRSKSVWFWNSISGELHLESIRRAQHLTVTFVSSSLGRLKKAPGLQNWDSRSTKILQNLWLNEYEAYFNLMVRLQSWRFGQYRLLLHYHYSQVHSEPEC